MKEKSNDRPCREFFFQPKKRIGINGRIRIKQEKRLKGNSGLGKLK